MDSQSQLKKYYEECYSAKDLYNTYLVPDTGFTGDAITTPIRQMSKLLKSGNVKGDLVMQVGNSHLLYLLLPARGHFKEMIIADDLKSNIEELNKWRENKPGAIDWTHGLDVVPELAMDSKCLTDMEDELRGLIRQVLTCDVLKANPFSPTSVPPADCLLSLWHLEKTCVDIKNYTAALKNLANLLKPGGRLVLLASIGATFYLVGKHMFPLVYLKEESLRKAVTEAGYLIEQLDLTLRKEQCLYDFCDFTEMAFLVACKQME